MNKTFIKSKWFKIILFITVVLLHNALSCLMFVRMFDYTEAHLPILLLLSVLFLSCFYFLTYLFSDSKAYMIIVSAVIFLVNLVFFIFATTNPISSKLAEHFSSASHAVAFIFQICYIFPILPIELAILKVLGIENRSIVLPGTLLVVFSILFYLVCFVSRHIKKRKKGDDNVKIENS